MLSNVIVNKIHLVLFHIMEKDDWNIEAAKACSILVMLMKQPTHAEHVLTQSNTKSFKSALSNVLTINPINERAVIECFRLFSQIHRFPMGRSIINSLEKCIHNAKKQLENSIKEGRLPEGYSLEEITGLTRKNSNSAAKILHMGKTIVGSITPKDKDCVIC